ncbi:hypothetical protein Tco_1293804 [Tanacetum coccineum]
MGVTAQLKDIRWADDDEEPSAWNIHGGPKKIVRKGPRFFQLLTVKTTNKTAGKTTSQDSKNLKKSVAFVQYWEAMHSTECPLKVLQDRSSENRVYMMNKPARRGFYILLTGSQKPTETTSPDSCMEYVCSLWFVESVQHWLRLPGTTGTLESVSSIITSSIRPGGLVYLGLWSSEKLLTSALWGTKLGTSIQKDGSLLVTKVVIVEWHDYLILGKNWITVEGCRDICGPGGSLWGVGGSGGEVVMWDFFGANARKANAGAMIQAIDKKAKEMEKFNEELERFVGDHQSEFIHNEDGNPALSQIQTCSWLNVNMVVEVPDSSFWSQDP